MQYNIATQQANIKLAATSKFPSIHGICRIAEFLGVAEMCVKLPVRCCAYTKGNLDKSSHLLLHNAPAAPEPNRVPANLKRLHSDGAVRASSCPETHECCAKFSKRAVIFHILILII